MNRLAQKKLSKIWKYKFIFFISILFFFFPGLRTSTKLPGSVLSVRSSGLWDHTDIITLTTRNVPTFLKDYLDNNHQTFSFYKCVCLLAAAPLASRGSIFEGIWNGRKIA